MWVVWLVAGVLIVLLLGARYLQGRNIQWPSLPALPQVELAPIKAFAVKGWEALVSLMPEEEAKPVEEPLPLMSVAPIVAVDEAPSAELLKLRQQLTDAEDKIKQLELVVQQKDQAIAQEISLRGQSLVAQYARLIERALTEGQPFPWELEQLQRITQGQGGEVAELAQQLLPYAAGVASREMLQEEFRTLSAEVFLRWKKREAGGGVSSALSQMLQQIIRIRRVGLVEGDDPEAILARAEYYLEKGQLKEAHTEMQALVTDYTVLVSPWLKQAELRLEAEKLLVALHGIAERAPSLNKDKHDQNTPHGDLANPQETPAP